MKGLSIYVGGAVALLTLSACGHEFHPPDEAERVAQAEEAFSPALFDSVSWLDQDARSLEGNTVYAEKCRRCHGALGRGDTGYARERGLEMPSLVEPEWALANVDTLRRVIFVGHEGGMPTYGSSGISPRQIDAAAFYILSQLRTDALGGEGS